MSKNESTTVFSFDLIKLLLSLVPLYKILNVFKSEEHNIKMLQHVVR